MMARKSRSQAASPAALPAADRSPLPLSMIAEPPHLDADLRELKLPAFVRHWRSLAERAYREPIAPQQMLAELAHLEVTQRRERRINRRIQEAHFPLLKTLDSFDFTVQPSLSREQILELAHGEFVERHENIIFVGDAGTGKSHLSIAIGIACCQRELRVRFFTAAQLTQTLIEAKAENRLTRMMDRLMRFDVLICDEVGFLPVDKLGSELLFTFVGKAYEKRSLIVTTNLPFTRWAEVFHDPIAAVAVVDRLVHHGIIVQTEGESYRLRTAKSQQRKETR